MASYKQDVFISYARKDYVDADGTPLPENPVSKVLQTLEDAGITYWLDKEGIYSSNEFAMVIGEAIQESRMLLFISSQNSNESIWTAGEVASARELKRPIIPFRIDASPYGTRVLVCLASLDSIDYATLKEKALQRLVDSIKSVLRTIAAEEKRNNQPQGNLREEDMAARELAMKISFLQAQEASLHQQKEDFFQELSTIDKAKVQELRKKERDVFARHVNERRKHRKAVCLQIATVALTALVGLAAWYGIHREKSKASAANELLIPVAYNRETASIEYGASEQSITVTTKHDGKEYTQTKTVTFAGGAYKLIKVKGGTFQMGATPEQWEVDKPDELPDPDELPVHQVTLGDYYIGETEVPQGLWQAVMGCNPSHFVGEENPVEQVSWQDCDDFIKALNQRTGMNFSLPTEAEWEYAARGGEKSQGFKYSGSNNPADVAWFDTKETSPVKSKRPNELGLYNMSGNVTEWCQDWYDTIYHANAQGRGPQSGDRKVNRGGAYSALPGKLRVSYRDCEPKNSVFSGAGLRLVLK